MNKIMKMVTVVAGVGAMLSFAGCGEKDPAQEYLQIMKELSAACVVAGKEDMAAGMKASITEIETDIQKGSFSEEDKKGMAGFVKEYEPKMSSIKKYSRLLGELNAIDPLLVESHCLPEFDRFCKKKTEEQVAAIKKIEKLLSDIRNALRR